MVTLHHLNNSHSHVSLWLMEELGAPYEIVHHQRDAKTFLSPDTLKAINPIGKAPTIEDHGISMVESTGVILYLLEVYGGGRLRPAPDTAEAMQFYQWLTFIEGSAKAPLMGVMRTRRSDASDRAKAAGQAAVDAQLGVLNEALAGKTYIVGEAFSAADIQLTFFEELAEGLGLIAPFPNMIAHMERMRERPAYKRAEEKGGPVGFRRMFTPARG